MTYIASEYTKISEKWLQLISRIVDLKEQPTSQPVSQSVCLYLTDKLTSVSWSVSLSLTDRQTDLNNIYIYI